MRHAVLFLLLTLAATSPAAAQSCSTLGSQVDCGGIPTKQRTQPSPPPRADNVDVQGNAEVEISNRGASTTLNNRVIDSHGIVEFEFNGSRSNCRTPGYGSPCR